MPLIHDVNIIAILDYWGIYINFRDYDEIWIDKKFTQHNMYNPDYYDNAINTNPIYNPFDTKDSHITRSRYSNLPFFIKVSITCCNMYFNCFDKKWTNTIIR